MLPQFPKFSKEWQAIKEKVLEMEKQGMDALVSAKDWEACTRAQEKIKVCKTILSWEAPDAQ